MNVHRYRTWAEAAGLPELSARLDRLPAGLSLPEGLPEPIRFDPQRKRLVYRGFMSSASYRYLHGLSADPTWLEALDAIFHTSADALPAPGRGRLWSWLLVTAGLAAAGGAVWYAFR
jgi:hypothetical protein